MGADAVRAVAASPSVVTAVLRPAAAVVPAAPRSPGGAADGDTPAPPPPAAPVEWRVRLDVVGRAAEADAAHAAFYGSEYTRQTLAAPGGAPPAVKWIETTTRYALVGGTADGVGGGGGGDAASAGGAARVVARQRVATYAPAPAGGVSPVPVDVRVYEMVYERLPEEGGGLAPGGDA